MDTFEAADAERFRRGYPDLVELVDGHADDKRATRNAQKARFTGDPDVYRVAWPRKVAHAYVRLYATARDTRTEVDVSPPTLEELRAVLARVVIPGFVETYSFQSVHALYIAEAVLGSEVVASAILDRLAQLKPEEWSSSDVTDYQSYVTDVLADLWARCSPAAARSLTRRRDAVLADRPTTSPLTRRLALLPDGACPYQEGEFLFASAYLHAKDGAARRAYYARHRTLDEWSVRFHWLEGGEDLLTHPMKNLHATPKWRVLQLLEDYGRLKHPGVVRLIAHLAHRSYVSAAAHAWLVEHRDFAEASLADLAGADEQCRDVLGTLRGQAKTKPKRPQNEESLLALVYERPDDDEPRLVLADHYAEKEDPRGELIVAQIHQARGKATAAEIKRATTLTNRADVRKLVFGALAPALAPKHSLIERGFLAHAHVQKRTKELAADPAWATVTSLQLEVSSAKAEDVLLEQPAVLRGLKRVGGLHPDALARLATGKGDNGIEDVQADLRSEDLDRVIAAIRAELPGLPRLQRLSLWVGEITAETLSPLLRGAMGARLKVLALDVEVLEPALVAWLALVPKLETQAALHLHWAAQYSPNWYGRLTPGEDGRLSALTLEYVRPPEKELMPFVRKNQYFDADDPQGVALMAATATLFIARTLETIGVDVLTRFALVDHGFVPVDAAALERLQRAARRQKRLKQLDLPPVQAGVVEAGR